MEFKIYGEDLANLEDKIKKLEKEKSKLEALPWALRKVQKKRISSLAQEIERLGYAAMSAQEHVRADPLSQEQYNKIQENKKRQEQSHEKNKKASREKLLAKWLNEKKPQKTSEREKSLKREQGMEME